MKSKIKITSGGKDIIPSKEIEDLVNSLNFEDLVYDLEQADRGEKIEEILKENKDESLGNI